MKKQEYTGPTRLFLFHKEILQHIIVKFECSIKRVDDLRGSFNLEEVVMSTVLLFNGIVQGPVAHIFFFDESGIVLLELRFNEFSTPAELFFIHRENTYKFVCPHECPPCGLRSVFRNG